MTVQPSQPAQMPVPAQSQVPTRAAPGPAMPVQPPSFNQIHCVTSKGGWPALFTGANQAKAINSAIAECNARGYRVAAAVPDRWTFLKRLGMAMLASLSLGFYVRRENVILITEPNR